MTPPRGGVFYITMNRSIAIGLVFLACCGSAMADDTLFNIAEADSMVPDSARIILRIERSDHALGRFTDTIDVSLQSTGQLMAGFDLKVATSNQYVAILNILPGEIYDSCEWDYFSARPLQRIGMLLLRLEDPGPLTRYRAAQALQWLDPDVELPVSVRIAQDKTQAFALNLAVIIVNMLLAADRDERLRLTGLVQQVLREADRVRQSLARAA